MVHPAFLYGTAWKDERTAALTRSAIEAGFRGIDTANQRRHYFEQGVGDALESVYRDGRLARPDLFLQTKFTYMGGQDHRLPYDPAADLPTQVRQSFASSLEHLRTDYVDSYVLHGPSVGRGLGEADFAVWKTMEGLCREGKARVLGVSNVNLGQLRLLAQAALILPRFVQNRCFAANRWDGEVRRFCAEHDMVYQGFSLLTANVHVLTGPEMVSLAQRRRRTIPQLVFRFAQQVGMLPLTGTTDVGHMHEDLASTTFDLAEDEVALIESIGVR
ncbi:MAG TPA: aldo/keto reductase [Candidatus Bathyarchaeia archaeon]|nr:aldo/keto reductase [Candidatus Bathyarchaeia archaeon]